MATFSARDVAVRRVTRLMSQLAVITAFLPAASYGGVVDAFGVEARTAARDSTAKSSRGSVFDSCSLAGMSGVSTPPAAIIATRDGSSGLNVHAIPEHSVGWQVGFRAAGYAAHPAFQEEWKSVAATDVVNCADDGNVASDTRGQGGAGHGPEWMKGIDLHGMPDWLRTVRLGLRTTAFTFYLSPSIPGMDGSAY